MFGVQWFTVLGEWVCREVCGVRLREENHASAGVNRRQCGSEPVPMR